MVGGKEYPAACGKTKREAKEEAAKLAYYEICSSKTTVSGAVMPLHVTQGRVNSVNHKMLSCFVDWR